MSLSATIQANLNRVRERLAAACARSDRDPAEVTLVAVTKYAAIDWIRALYDLGHRDFGESRPQQLTPRAAQLPADVRWHMIGHLQRNKVRPVMELGATIHSIDTPRLLDRVETLARELSITPDVLIEVNVAGEANKDGCAPAELLGGEFSRTKLTQTRVVGLMTMAPMSDEPESARPVFRRLRELRDELRARAGLFSETNGLSMGMSGDFEVAVEEGATLIRLGSTLFEGLTQ